MSQPIIAPLGALGRFPAEVRCLLYDEVFGPTKVITPMRPFSTALSGDQLLQPEVYTNALVDTSILRTNKEIRSEVLDMLYRNRIVRGSISELNTLLRDAEFRDLVRSIEIDDHFSAFQPHQSAHDLLAEIGELSQIRSTTILSDRFAFTRHNGRSYVTVREFATMTHLGEAICVDIGRFRLRGNFNHVQIVHHKLVKMWPHVVSTPEDYDVYADVLGLDGGDDRCIFSMFNGVAWAAQTSLRRWVRLYDEFMHAPLDPVLVDKTDEERALLGKFVLSTRELQHLHPGTSTPNFA